MKPGVFAKTFAGTTPETVLAAARAAGYEAAQYNMACSGLGSLPPTISPATATAVGEAAAAAGVEIAAVSATYNMIHPDLAERERGRQAFAAIAAAAHRMGTRLLTVCTGSRNPHDQWGHHPDTASAAAWDEMCREFGYLLDVAERCDVLLGIEPEPANVVDSARRARQLIATLGSPRIRIVFDPANLFERASTAQSTALIDEAIDLLGDRIALAHAKDRRADGQVTTAGSGVIAYGHVVAALRRAGFDGALVAHGIAAHEAAGVARFLATVLTATGEGG